MDGTGWYTIDANGVWKGWAGNAMSFGLHRDQEDFSQIKVNTSNWLTGAATGIATTIAPWATALGRLFRPEVAELSGELGIEGVLERSPRNTAR